MEKRKMILASSSPRRKDILLKHEISFDIVVSDVDESIPNHFAPWQGAMYVAYKKASAVSALKREKSGGIILAADTIVYKDKIMGKPINEQHAKEMLQALRNGEHKVITGVAIILQSEEGTRLKQMLFYEETKVFFHNYSDEEIERYIASGEVWGKAGSYAIQGGGAAFCEKIQGDLENVIGLPFTKVEEMLQKHF